MQDYLYGLIKVTSAATLAFFFFATLSEKARRSSFQSATWFFLGLSLLTTIVFTNALTVHNNRVLAFLFPEMVCFILLLGPAYYFGTTLTRPKSKATAWFHVCVGALFLCGALWQGWIQDITTQHFQDQWNNNGAAIDIQLNSFTTKPFQILLAPIHFFFYFIAASKKEIPSVAKLFGLGILLNMVLMNITFSGAWKGEAFMGALFVANSFTLVCGFLFVLNYPLSKYEAEELKKGLAPMDFGRIEQLLAEEKKLVQVLTIKGVSLSDLVMKTGISFETWSTYLTWTDFTFIGFKRKIRIQYVKKLIDSGYLNQYSVDGLSEKIGYQSRTSFYSAFKEVEGVSFTVYRKALADK